MLRYFNGEKLAFLRGTGNSDKLFWTRKPQSRQTGVMGLYVADNSPGYKTHFTGCYLGFSASDSTRKMFKKWTFFSNLNSSRVCVFNNHTRRLEQQNRTNELTKVYVIQRSMHSSILVHHFESLFLEVGWKSVHKRFQTTKHFSELIVHFVHKT